jgi:LysM repeat protein
LFAEATRSRVAIDTSTQGGFNEQKFVVSPLDELAKLELTQNEEKETRRVYRRIKTEINALGEKPVQLKDGKVPIVMSYYNEYLNDPYSMRFVRWSPVTKYKYLGIDTFWAVSVKFRAKNVLGAYVLAEETYLIQKGKVARILKGFLYKEELPETKKPVENTAQVKKKSMFPSVISIPVKASNVRVVKAQAGDTVAKVAQRAGANATEVAKFNGLLPNSVLPAGREIKIPAN